MNLGVCAIDSTMSTEFPGFNFTTIESWKRTSVLYNNKELYRTAAEKNNLGLYKLNNKLSFSGNTITEEDAVLSCGEELKYGNVQLTANNQCINITLEDYNSLRSGWQVPGYGAYNKNLVYNIVKAEDLNIPVQFESKYYTNLYNAIYTSVETPNQLSNSTYKLLDPPQIYLRHFDSNIGTEDSIVLNFFVDDYYASSINKNKVGELFTTIIEDSSGNVIYSRTTYAGPQRVIFKPNTQPNTEDWISIRCIDSRGVGSVEHFLEFYVNGTEERLYPMTESDLEHYNIVQNSGVSNLEQGHKNSLGFRNLIQDVISQGYNGIKVYNKNPNPMSQDSKHLNESLNSIYCLDVHKSISENPLNLSKINQYFLVYFDGTSFVGASKSGSTWNISDFSRFKLTKNQSITVNGKQFTVNKDPYTWIQEDGAKIYRDENNKVIVAWSFVLPTEVQDSDPGKAERRVLRMRNLNAIVAALNESNNKNLLKQFPEGPGYYYLNAFNDGSIKGTHSSYAASSINAGCIGSPAIVMPDNFTIDFNNTIIKRCNADDIEGFAYVFAFERCRNAHIRNFKLYIEISNQVLKRAYLKQCKINVGSTMEGSNSTIREACKYCSIKNFEHHGGTGYELLQSVMGLKVPKTAQTGTTRLVFNKFGYVNTSLANITSKSSCILKDSNGKSLLLPAPTDLISETAGYTDNYIKDSSDVCLLTSQLINCNFGFSYKRHNSNTTITERLDQFYLNGAAEPGTVSSGTAKDYGGSYPWAFINFYNSGQCFKVIKVLRNCMIKIPQNAEQMSVTVYGFCDSNKNIVYENFYDKDGNFRFSREKSLAAYYATNMALTVGSVLQNGYIRDTKSIIFGGVGINTLMQDCEFKNIATATSSEFRITSILMDIEENHKTNKIFALKNCHVLPGPGRSSIAAGNTYFMEVSDCSGLSIGGSPNYSYFVNNIFSQVSTMDLKRDDSMYSNIYINTIICNPSRFLYSKSRNKSGSLRSTQCGELVSKIQFEDCLVCKSKLNSDLPDKPRGDSEVLSNKVYYYKQLNNIQKEATINK